MPTNRNATRRAGMDPLVGVRWKCVECPGGGFDLCGGCMRSGAHERHTAGHTFAVVPPPAPAAAAAATRAAAGSSTASAGSAGQGPPMDMTLDGGEWLVHDVCGVDGVDVDE